MSLLGFASKLVKDFRGAWTRTDSVTMRANRAYVAQNVRFSPGRVKSREGLENRLTAAGKVTTIFHWITTQINSVILFDNGIVKLFNVLASVNQDVYTEASARGVVVSQSGIRAFVASFLSTGLGAGQCRVIDAQAAVIPPDKAFMGPFGADSQAVTEPSAGNITAGTHLFGFVPQSRTGFISRPSPEIAGVFSPLSFTAAGAKIARYQIQIDTPQEAGFVYPIMTRADNPNKYFYVPQSFGGGAIAIPPSTLNWVVTWNLNISDADLATIGELVDEEFDLITQDAAGNGPFNPHFVKAYGRRMSYIVDKDIYFSDEDDTQHITEAFHKLTTPEQRTLAAAGIVRNVYCAYGRSWTYGFTDRPGEKPATWPSAQLISSRIGTPAPHGVTDDTGGDYNWVAHESGLWRFAGAYDRLPISYMADDIWKRINWAAGYTIQVREDILAQRVIVAVPLDAATEPNYLLGWDFSRGFDPMEVDFSWDVFNSAALASGLFSAIGFVTETDNKNRLWVGPAAAGQIKRFNASLHDDTSDAGAPVAINSRYRSGGLLAEGEGGALARGAALRLELSGNGTLSVTIYSPDFQRTAGPFSVSLVASPDDERYVRFDLNWVANFCAEFATNAAGAYFDLNRLHAYYKPMATNL